MFIVTDSTGYLASQTACPTTDCPGRKDLRRHSMYDNKDLCLHPREVRFILTDHSAGCILLLEQYFQQPIVPVERIYDATRRF
jgi:hypothetical protein